MGKIKFYSTEDIASEYYLKLTKDYINQIDEINIEEMDINGIIELYNVSRYCEEFNMHVAKDEIDKNLSKIKKSIGNFFSEFSLAENRFDYEKIEYMYKEDFWEIFNRYGLLKKTSVNDFTKFIKSNELRIYEILRYEKICEKYKVPIKKCLLNNPDYFEFFLRKYNEDGHDIHIPNNITHEELNDWARRFCEQKEPNINFLEQIANWSNFHEYKLDKKIILKAKKIHDQIVNSTLEAADGSFWTISVALDDSLYDSFDFQHEGMDSKISVGKGWLEENTDPATILNNFIYYLNFFDPLKGFCFIPSKYGETSFTEIFNKKYKYEYEIGFLSQYMNLMYKLIFRAYFDMLQYKNIDFEEVFDYFYNIHIGKEIEVSGFFYNSSTQRNTYYDRCKAIIPEIDSIIKQFTLYRENLEIDHELYEITDDKTDYRQVKSFSPEKFVYIKSEKLENFAEILFSRKSLLANIKDGRDDDKTLAEHMESGLNEKQLISYQMEIIEELINYEIISRNIVGQLYFTEKKYIVLMKFLWEKGYICTLELSKELNGLINKKVQKGELQYGGTLVSSQESDYISYVMDNKKYSNALAIRNRYAHGTFARKKETDHKENYLALLVILLLYTYRINEELEYSSREKH